MRSPRAALLAVLCLANACGSPPTTPIDVAAEYLRDIGRDPIRTLPLLTPEFHRRHALHVVTGAEARAPSGQRPLGNRDVEPVLAIDRHQLAWLAVQSRPELARLLAGMTMSFSASDLTSQSDDRASLTIPIEPRDAPAFEQHFSLVRSAPDAAWRIDAIEQSGVVPENAAAAFAAYPNEHARRALAANGAR